MATSTVPPVFVYGSLMAPEVLNIVLNRIPRTTPAVLHGYARYRIKQRVYPAIVPSLATHRVDGLLLQDLSSHDLEVLCEFEAPEYMLCDVQPQLEDGSIVERAHAHKLGQTPWSYDEFRQQHLDEYKGMCTRWAEKQY